MHLVSFWDGPVCWLERLCVMSMLEQGHTLTIYSYTPDALLKAGLHTDIRDAREITPETHSSYRYAAIGRYNMFTNIFRVELQRQGKGVWLDLDCFQIRPLTSSEYILGWLSDRKLNNAVLGLPKDAALTADYLAGISAMR